MSNVIHIKNDENFNEFLEDYCTIDFEYDCRDKIEDVNNFVRELERAGLMTKELENFIEGYLRWDNN